MKRFFFLSIFFHGFLLLLLFSRETPLANKFSPKVLIHVSLIERIEEKKPQKILSPIRKEPERVKAPEKKEIPPAPEKKEVQKEEKKEEKIEQAQAILKEEKRKGEEQVPSENKAMRPQVEQALVTQAKIMLESHEGGDPESLPPPEAKGDPRGKEGAGSTFLASRVSGGGAEGIGPGGGDWAPGRAKGGGSPGRMANIGPSSGGLDPILSLIIRKIEAAKRYPRMARKMGIEGTAVVRFKLRSEGQVEAVEIMKSSGSEILDKASMETVRDAAPLPYKDGWLKVGIVFKIL